MRHFSSIWTALVSLAALLLLLQGCATPPRLAAVPVPVSYTHLDVYKRQVQSR